MVITRRDIGCERTKRIKESLMTKLHLEIYVLLDLMYGNMTGPSIITCTSCSRQWT